MNNVIRATLAVLILGLGSFVFITARPKPAEPITKGNAPPSDDERRELESKWCRQSRTKLLGSAVAWFRKEEAPDWVQRSGAGGAMVHERDHEGHTPDQAQFAATFGPERMARWDCPADPNTKFSLTMSGKTLEVSCKTHGHEAFEAIPIPDDVAICLCNMREISGSATSCMTSSQPHAKSVTLEELVQKGYLKKVPLCSKGNHPYKIHFVDEYDPDVECTGMHGKKSSLSYRVFPDPNEQAIEWPHGTPR